MESRQITLPPDKFTIMPANRSDTIHRCMNLQAELLRVRNNLPEV